jgi:hypothetical protein
MVPCTGPRWRKLAKQVAMTNNSRTEDARFPKHTPYKWWCTLLAAPSSSGTAHLGTTQNTHGIVSAIHVPDFGAIAVSA